MQTGHIPSRTRRGQPRASDPDHTTPGPSTRPLPDQAILSCGTSVRSRFSGGDEPGTAVLPANGGALLLVVAPTAVARDAAVRTLSR